MKEQLKNKVYRMIANCKDISFEDKGIILKHICAGEIQLEEKKKDPQTNKLLAEIRKSRDDITETLGILKHLHKSCEKVQNLDDHDEKCHSVEPPTQQDVEEYEEGDPHYPQEPRT